MWTALASRALDCLTCGGLGHSAATTEAAAADGDSTSAQQQPRPQQPPPSPQHKPAEVLLPDGKVLRVPHKTKCADLVAAHPRTRVFPATVLVGRPGKMVPEDAPLQGGQVYALLPVGTRMRMAFTVPKEYLSLLRGPAAAADGGDPAMATPTPAPAAGAGPTAAISSAAPAAAGSRSGGPSMRQRNASSPARGKQQHQQQEAAAAGAEEEERPMTTSSSNSGVAMRRGPSRVHDWSGPLQNWSGPLHSISETEADD